MGLAFDRSGSGEPLVLVHGVGSRWQVWDAVRSRLAAHHDVIAVDLPGFGASEPDGTVPDVESQAVRLEAFFAELGLERPHVAGNSMGGGIALELARRGSIASATALSPVGFWTPRERAFAIGSLKATQGLLPTIRPALPLLAATGVGRTLLFEQLFFKPWKLTRDEVVATVDAFLGSASTPRALELFREHTFHDADELRGVPVTVAWGDHDYLLLSRQRDRAREVLPWARHVALPGCGHVPMADDPELVATVLLAGARSEGLGAG
ncbi:MAG: alpha/beta hydrolase [Solirubrobacterales bacterium]|jgi:pimeloyl-ACP methyl ester carboxylesterase|nr:alpha/beta hydrolase [Solirubrobacterales bacterium]